MSKLRDNVPQRATTRMSVMLKRSGDVQEYFLNVQTRELDPGWPGDKAQSTALPLEGKSCGGANEGATNAVV